MSHQAGLFDCREDRLTRRSRSIGRLLFFLLLFLALAAGPVLAQQPGPSLNIGQLEADFIFSIGGAVAISWATANFKKIFKGLHGAGTVAVSIILSYVLAALVLLAENQLKIPKLLICGAIVAKLANGYYNQRAQKTQPAVPGK